MTLIADSVVNGGGGGEILFHDDSTAAPARVEVFGNGSVSDISGHNATGVTIGSLGGNGLAFLGANNLAVGTNHRSTIFSGTIQDGGASVGTGGSLTKVGLAFSRFRIRTPIPVRPQSMRVSFSLMVLSPAQSLLMEAHSAALELPRASPSTAEARFHQVKAPAF